MQFTCSGQAQTRGMTLIDGKIPDEIAGTLFACSHEVNFLFLGSSIQQEGRGKEYSKAGEIGKVI